jgi:peptidoglycan/LPS O-acetylase OafA/YrhL
VGEEVAGVGRALTTGESLLVSLLALAASLGLALAMYHWIETPVMRLLGRPRPRVDKSEMLRV